jgi:uncharacterized iron-regulated protein
MGPIQKLIIGVLVCLPATTWSADMHYALDVKINTSEQKISGIARLIADSDKKITLSVLNLSKLKVDGKAVAADESISITVLSSKETLISYEALFTDNKANFISKENVFLTGGWYPRPDDLVEYALSVTLPKKFIATSEAETVTVQKHGKTKTFKFQFNHPLDILHLAASTRYVLKKGRYRNISIEAYFFKEDSKLAGAYIAHAKKYLAMYETMLTPYPYKRFAIVENIFPSGNSMPTFTLLGSRVVHLPFIVKTSLGHEILHQWFGNSVYIDFEHGNWAEGITAYLADHYYAAIEGKDTAYRKQIMVDYNAYVNKDNTMPVSDFYSRHNKAQSSIGYGKTAMLFHGLRRRFGDKSFFTALREFLQKNSFRAASWNDIQLSFEKATGEKLHAYFEQWLSRKDIPIISVKNAELKIEQGQIKLNFALLQQDEAYQLRIPVTLYFDKGKSLRFLELMHSKKNISLKLDELPKKVVIDENYTLMRQLAPEEIPPVLATVMGKEKLIVIVAANRRDIYQPLIDALGVENITYLTPDKITFAQMKENSFLIAGHEDALVDMLFGKQHIPKDGVRLKVYKNPYNTAELIALLHVKNKAEAKAVHQKIPHYGKYTELAFKDGSNNLKAIAKTNNGILVLSRPPTWALKPDKLATLDEIIPKLLSSRIIYLGEKHDQFAHHINQLHVIKKIHESGYELAVGMEMFQKPFQKVVNDFLAGRIDEHNFLLKSEYFKRWRYDYNLYKPIIDYLKQQNIPLVALNIKGDINKKVARKGIYSLSDKRKKQLPSSMDFSNEQYRDDLNKVFTLHAEQEEIQDFNYFLQAQTLWDEVMAESAHQFLTNNPDSKIVILAGNGHVRHKYGIPERLYRRNLEPFTVVVQDEEIEDGIADYVLLTTKLKGKESPKLGLMVEEKDQGLVIIGVNNISPAKQAGLQEGDIIKQFAGQSIKSLADLKLALFNKEIGSPLKIRVKRDDKLLDKDIELFHF